MRVAEFYGEFLGNAKAIQGGEKREISQFGFGASNSFGANGLGGILEYDYRRIDLTELNIPDLTTVNSHEFYFGLRYLPMLPTLIVGQVGLRPTVGGMVGVDLEPNWRTLFFGGVVISPIRTVSGISANISYRPGTKATEGYEIAPSWMLRIGIMRGPTAK
jgi:hypothetical protein